MDDKKNGFHFPSIPKGKDYEDYIAAILASDGYYLERNIHCWIDKEDLLELDIVSTKFSRTTVNRELIEIKSGDNWGYSDIFKVFGWMKYLGYKKGSFIVRKKAKLTDFTKEHCKNFFNIDLIINPESEVKNYLDDSELLAKFNIKPEKLRFALLYRVAFALETEMLFYLHERTKSFSGSKENNGYNQLENYYKKINSLSFFCADEVTRIKELILSFNENRNISGRLSELESSKIFPKDVNNFNNEVFRKIFYTADEISPIYVSLYIEVFAKLELIKTCVLDYFSSKKDDIYNLLQHDTLPLSIGITLQNIDCDKYFYLYPYFWQVFIFLFGGFIIKPFEKEEYALLSKFTNIPIEEIPNAFRFFDRIFHLSDEKTWFCELPYTQIKMLKMFPLPLAGNGVFFRALLFKSITGKSEINYFETLEKEFKDHTVDDMKKWALLEFKFLERGKRFKK